MARLDRGGESKPARKPPRKARGGASSDREGTPRRSRDPERGRRTREPEPGWRRKPEERGRPAQQDRREGRQDRQKTGRDDGWIIEGRQPVREALRAGRSIRRILIADTAHLSGALGEIFTVAREAGVRVDRVPKASLDSRSTTRAHQGVMAETTIVEPRSWREGLAKAKAAGVAPLFLALDEIQDPQNLGALLRSAEVLGVHAVLITKRRSAAITPMVVKAAAGATEHLVIDEVASLERALAACREEGLWIVALAGEGADSVEDCALLEEPVVVVVGAEGSGVSALIRQRADALVRIPVTGRIESLNASAAGAIALWEVARRRTRR